MSTELEMRALQASRRPNVAPSPETLEIDVHEVLRELRKQPPQRPEEGISSDPDVFALDLTQRVPRQVAPCPVCRSNLARPTFGISGLRFQLVTCTDCGTGALDPRPTAADLRHFYTQSYYGGSGAKFQPGTERLVRSVAARHARALQSELPSRGRVLDVGCGRGVLLNALCELGFEAYGTEISEHASAGVDPRAKLAIAPDLAGAGYPDDFFDGVVLSHVLEHLLDPRETLDEVRRILRPGGRIAVAVPNLESFQARWAGPAWFHLDLPRHIFHFPLPALQLLLEDCGFRIARVRHFSLRQNPFGWLQSALNRIQGSRNALYHLLRRNNGQALQPSRAARASMRLAYAAGMPLGLLASAVDSLFSRGATVEVTAVRA